MSDLIFRLLLTMLLVISTASYTRLVCKRLYGGSLEMIDGKPVFKNVVMKGVVIKLEPDEKVGFINVRFEKKGVKK